MGKLKHGLLRRSVSRPPEYVVWGKMNSRCRNPRAPDWKNYGGRGITVCERWRDYTAFISDMGPRPTAQHSIERVDNDRGYEPGNCIWATRAVQVANRRPRKPPTHCVRGHPFDETNTYHRPDGKRGCKECRRSNLRSLRASKRAEANV
jgi:hypothetical protein